MECVDTAHSNAICQKEKLQIHRKEKKNTKRNKTQLNCMHIVYNLVENFKKANINK